MIPDATLDIELPAVPTGPLTFYVEGYPATQGSKVAFKHPVSGKVIQMDSNKRLPAWRAEVAYVARQHMVNRVRWDGCALSVVYEFYLPRPKGHFGKHGLRTNAPRWPIAKMDFEKLARACSDAMTGFVYQDDGQICMGTIYKRYADELPPGVRITVNGLE